LEGLFQDNLGKLVEKVKVAHTRLPTSKHDRCRVKQTEVFVGVRLEGGEAERGEEFG